MASVTLSDLAVQLDGHTALDGIDLVVEDGDALAVLGPSGAGKSTMLRAIAGLVTPSRGRILLDDEDVTDVPTRLRRVGLVAQGAPLQDTHSVAGNVAMPMRFRAPTTAEERRRRVTAEARAFGLLDLLRRRPSSLSEGQRHAAATARAAVVERRALLLDEPAVHLDRDARTRYLTQIQALQRAYGTTVVLATNEVGVARAVARRVAVLVDGRLVQTGRHEDLLAAPGTLDVLDLVADSPPARIVGRVEHGAGGGPARVVTAAGSLPCWAPALRAHGGPVVVALGQDDLVVADNATAHLHGRVDRVASIGSHRLVSVATPAGRIVVRSHRAAAAPDGAVELRVRRAVVAGADGRVLAVVEPG